MALDMCIESYGAVVYAVDSLLSSGFYVRTRARGIRGQALRLDFDDRVRAAATDLPWSQSQALWLVDVCGSSYAEAAIEARCSREVIVERVRDGRRSIRDLVAIEQAESAVS